MKRLVEWKVWPQKEQATSIGLSLIYKNSSNDAFYIKTSFQLYNEEPLINISSSKLDIVV